MRANTYEAILSVCNMQLSVLKKHQTSAKGYSVNRFFIIQKVLYNRNYQGFIIFNTILLICNSIYRITIVVTVWCVEKKIFWKGHACDIKENCCLTFFLFGKDWNCLSFFFGWSVFNAHYTSQIILSEQFFLVLSVSSAVQLM